TEELLLGGDGGVNFEVAQVCLDKGVLCREVLVEGSRRHVRGLGERRDPSGVDAVPVEQLRSCVQDSLTRATAAARLSGHVIGYHTPSIAITLPFAIQVLASAK